MRTVNVFTQQGGRSRFLIRVTLLGGYGLFPPYCGTDSFPPRAGSGKTPNVPPSGPQAIKAVDYWALNYELVQRFQSCVAIFDLKFCVNEGTHQGGGGRDACEHGLCAEGR